VRVRRVLDNLQVVCACDLEDRVHLGALPVQMHRDDRSRASGQRGFESGRVEHPGLGLDVDEHGSRSGTLDSGDRRHAGVRLRDHLVAPGDAHGAERDCDRVGPGGDADGMARIAEGGELVLELLDAGAEHEVRLVEDCRDRTVELVSDLRHLTRQLPEANHQYLAPCSR
jgi:hypothetical protein